MSRRARCGEMPWSRTSSRGVTRTPTGCSGNSTNSTTRAAPAMGCTTADLAGVGRGNATDLRLIMGGTTASPPRKPWSVKIYMSAAVGSYRCCRISKLTSSSHCRLHLDLIYEVRLRRLQSGWSWSWAVWVVRSTCRRGVAPACLSGGTVFFANSYSVVRSARGECGRPSVAGGQLPMLRYPLGTGPSMGRGRTRCLEHGLAVAAFPLVHGTESCRTSLTSHGGSGLREVVQGR